MADEFWWLDDPLGVNPRNDYRMWRRNQLTVAFASSLLSAPVENRAHGLQVTELSSAFGFSGKEDKRLITRNVTRNVYDAVFDEVVKGGQQCLVEGASGIGKSRNLAYLLKRLLQVNRIVLYHATKFKTIYAFVPPEQTYMTDDNTTLDRYICYAAHETEFKHIIIDENNLIKNRIDVVYLYDPPHGEGELPIMDCSVVVAASPNLRHFREFIRMPHREYKVNMFTVEEAQEFFNVIVPETAERSAIVPANTPASLPTPAGHVLTMHIVYPLSNEHIAIAVNEIGGNIRELTNWHTVMKAIRLRNKGIEDITDFGQFNLHQPSSLIATSDTAVHKYTSLLVTYHNDLNPNAMSYGEYICGVTARIISPGTLRAICESKYSMMYRRMLEMRDLGTPAGASEAGYYFELIAKTYLTSYTSFTVRDLESAVTQTRKPIKQNITLMKLSIGKGQLAPASADLLATVLALPAPATNGIVPWAAGERVVNSVIGAKRNRAEYEGAPVDMPIVRTLHHSRDNTDNIDAADAPRRGYHMTIAGNHKLHYTAMHNLLLAANCNVVHKYDLFVVVPEDRFDGWIHKLTLTKNDAPPLTDAQRNEINTSVHQYALRVPSAL